MSRTIYKTARYWQRVFDLLDTSERKRGTLEPVFIARGTVLHENWGVAFEQMVQMMYWADLISRYQPDHKTTTDRNMQISDANLFRLIAVDLNTTPAHIKSIVEKDPDYYAL